MLAVLTSAMVLAMTFTPVLAQTTVTPSPTSTSMIDQSYPPPVPTEPYYTETPNAYPGAPNSTLAPTWTPGPTFTPGLPTGSASATPGLPTPVFPTLTPNLTLAAPVITTTTSLTVTATLVPLPELTLVFPKQGADLLVTATPDAVTPAPPWTQPQRLVPLALIGLIWVILAGWFFYSQREL